MTLPILWKINHYRWLIILAIWIVWMLIYFNVPEKMYGNAFINETLTAITTDAVAESNKTTDPPTDNYLLDTPGCQIPNYTKTIIYPQPSKKSASCGTRAVEVLKISEQVIQFIIDKKKLKVNEEPRCNYRFVTRSTVPGFEDQKIQYTLSRPFHNGTKVKLEHEILTVSCTVRSRKKYSTIYTDSYMIVKKIIPLQNHNNNAQKMWNVLLLGIDTMSRGRFMQRMPLTNNYLKENGWLDYRAYQKVGMNTYPNLMAFLTGSKPDNTNNICIESDACKHKLMWTRYMEAGYITAYGEDFISLPDTFARFMLKKPPTHHYMRPLFLTSTETKKDYLICLQKKPSAVHILDYATDFVNTYKNQSFFGMFWINSIGHNPNQNPQQFDGRLQKLLEHLEVTGAMENTFVFLLGDHGIRFGNSRFQVEAYYDERLPMLYAWAPKNFRKLYSFQFKAMEINQHRLITPYEVYMTLREILQRSDTSLSIEEIPIAEGCVTCDSVFVEVTELRTCANAHVDDKWCSCHSLQRVDQSDRSANASLYRAWSYVQEFSRSVKTKRCFKCKNFELQKVHRIHYYRDSHRDFYVSAFTMSGGVGFEITTYVQDGEHIILPGPDTTITGYNRHGSCTKNVYLTSFCMCEKITNCK